jgi:hypothetical protein
MITYIFFFFYIGGSKQAQFKDDTRRISKFKAAKDCIIKIVEQLAINKDRVSLVDEKLIKCLEEKQKS